MAPFALWTWGHSSHVLTVSSLATLSLCSLGKYIEREDRLTKPHHYIPQGLSSYWVCISCATGLDRRWKWAGHRCPRKVQMSTLELWCRNSGVSYSDRRLHVLNETQHRVCCVFQLTELSQPFLKKPIETSSPYPQWLLWDVTRPSNALSH